MFTERLRRETTRLRLPVIEIDVGAGEDDVARRVTRGFGL